MLNYLKLQANKTLTENGAETYASTMSNCLDLFSTIGALRQADDQEITVRFLRAWAESRDIALKTAFYARDVRGGLGERRVFRVILAGLAVSNPKTVVKNLPYIVEMGRYDDLLVLMDTPCQDTAAAFIGEQLKRDIAALDAGETNISLLGKWLPSVNASSEETNRIGRKLAKALGMSCKEYRQTLSRLRRGIAILENNLRERDYSFDYNLQPSKAMLKYRKAFLRNDKERYQGYMELVMSGKAKLNTGTLYPYEIVAPWVNQGGEPGTKEERRALEATWNALPDYTNGENALVVADGSGSMYMSCYRPLPAAVAMSLAVYFAQRNRGAFRGHFMTFSRRPQLVQIKGRDLYEQIRYCMSFNEVANTNIEAVFELLLKTAVHNRLKQSELPSVIYIISDMEFDRCAENSDLTNFQNAKRKFRRAGYRLPRVVFWNVASRNLQQPVTSNEQGVVLVSGCSPRVFQLALSENPSPYRFMLEVLGAERYEKITAAAE